MPTHVVVDGSNIATEGGSTPSLKQLDEAVQAFMAEHPSDRVTVVVDASFGHRIDQSERAAYEEAIEANEVITPPAGTTGRGDAFILEIADRAGATVLSNDSFQEFHGEHAWLFDEGRLIGGKPVPDVGWVFLPRTPVRGPMSRRSTRDASRSAKAKAEGAEQPSGSGSGSGRSGGSDGSGDSGGGRSGSSRGGRGRGRGRGRKKDAEGDALAEAKDTSGDTGGGSGGGRRSASKKASGSGGDAPRPTRAEPLNEPLPFIEFVGEHPVGSTVTGEVERFTSHGAHVLVKGVRCYVDLSGLGDPPPTKARDVLSKEEDQDFLVLAVDTPRRGIDLALPGSVSAKEAGLGGGGGRGRAKKAPAKAASSEGGGHGGRAKKAAGRKSSAKAEAEQAGATKAGGRSRKKAASKADASKAGAAKSGGRAKKASSSKKASSTKKAGRGAKKAGGQKAEARKRGAASAPILPDPDDPNYGTIADPPPKKKGLLGRLTGR